jgi:hypothetical protein
MNIVHISRVYENYEQIGWRWQCGCGAHSIKPLPTNKDASRLGFAHQKRKHS